MHVVMLHLHMWYIRNSIELIRSLNSSEKKVWPD